MPTKDSDNGDRSEYRRLVLSELAILHEDLRALNKEIMRVAFSQRVSPSRSQITRSMPRTRVIPELADSEQRLEDIQAVMARLDHADEG